MGLSAELEAVLGGLPAAFGEPFAGHPVANLIRHGVADEVRATVSDDSYLVEGSPGRGNWADIVWVAAFDRLIIESAEKGFYPVYLFEPDGAGVYEHSLRRRIGR